MIPAKNNLLALGSAAVIAVYGAGFARTRAAAQRFAGEDARRRPAAPTSGAVASHASPAVRRPGVARDSSAAPAVARPPRRDRAAKAPAHTDSAAPVVAPAVPVATVVVPPVAADTVRAQTVVQKADTAQAADSVYRDGTYSGWGTSRHGDIQAAVEIKHGRIVDAYITQCLTQYSCSWISALPPQVAVRQSADVDYVSGATQSSNAFYSAVLQALNRAK